MWATGLLCCSLLIACALQANGAQRAAAGISTINAIASGTEASRGAASEHRVLRPGDVLGRLEIPGLALSVPVLEDDDTATLVRGVGHIPRTALPGGLGNLVLAAHRDTFFRPLRRIRAGMEIRIVTTGGDFRYVVDSTEIVLPEQVGVTAIGERPEMTLITCYPFDFIGAAPKRFIVHAHLISLDPALGA